MNDKQKKLKELSKTRKVKKVKVNEVTFEDFNPLDVLPETIDTDCGFFLMFGNPDVPISGQASLNF